MVGVSMLSNEKSDKLNYNNKAKNVTIKRSTKEGWPNEVEAEPDAKKAELAKETQPTALTANAMRTRIAWTRGSESKNHSLTQNRYKGGRPARAKHEKAGLVLIKSGKRRIKVQYE